MAPAVFIYPRDAYPDSTEMEPVEECLCEGCRAIRKEADKAKNLASWENEEGVNVAFFKVTLDMPELVGLLKDMFRASFFKEKGEVLDDDLGFSILKEFLHDYKKFLAAFKDEVLRYEDYGRPENHEGIMDNLFCIKIQKPCDIKPLVWSYAEKIESADFFAQMVKFAITNKKAFPIKLSITVSSVKCPFIEHWRRLNDPVEEIKIYAIPNVKLEVVFVKFKKLMVSKIEDRKVSAALHKLAEVEERTGSQFLTTVAMLDMKGDLKDLAKPLITTSELTINETLAYYKIMKGAQNNER